MNSGPHSLLTTASPHPYLLFPVSLVQSLPVRTIHDKSGYWVTTERLHLALPTNYPYTLPPPLPKIWAFSLLYRRVSYYSSMACLRSRFLSVQWLPACSYRHFSDLSCVARSKPTGFNRGKLKSAEAEKDFIFSLKLNLNEKDHHKKKAFWKNSYISLLKFATNFQILPEGHSSETQFFGCLTVVWGKLLECSRRRHFLSWVPAKGRSFFKTPGCLKSLEFSQGLIRFLP